MGQQKKTMAEKARDLGISIAALRAKMKRKREKEETLAAPSSLPSPASFRDRVKDFRRVPASSIRPHPRNPRQHPEEQRKAWRKVLASIGFADALLCRETADGSLQLIDGHLRAEDLGDSQVPVLVLDVTEAEADAMVVTFDRLTGMAEWDLDRVGDIMRDLSAREWNMNGMGWEMMIPEAECDSAGTTHSMRQQIGTSVGVVSIGKRSAFAPLDLLERLSKAVETKWGEELWGEAFAQWAINGMETVPDVS